MISFFSERNNLLKYYSFFIILLIILASYFHYSNIFIENLPDYLLYSFVIVSLMTLFFLVQKKEEELFTIADGFLIIHESKSKNQIHQKLAFEEIKFFETRFNEIVFHRLDNEKFSVKLDDVKSDKKRWEIKEFLRQHVPENKHHRNVFNKNFVNENIYFQPLNQ